MFGFAAFSSLANHCVLSTSSRSTHRYWQDNCLNICCNSLSLLNSLTSNKKKVLFFYMQLNICRRFLARSGVKVQSVPLKGVLTRSFGVAAGRVFVPVPPCIPCFHIWNQSQVGIELCLFACSPGQDWSWWWKTKMKMFLFWAGFCGCDSWAGFISFFFSPCWMKEELGIGEGGIAPFLRCCTNLGTSLSPSVQSPAGG